MANLICLIFGHILPKSNHYSYHYALCVRCHHWILREGKQMKKPVKYLGWIYGNKSDESLLRSLGIEGQMKWKLSDNSRSAKPFAYTKNGIFEMCEIPADKASEILPGLEREYPLFESTVFTGVDDRGRPICGLNWRDGQPAYEGEWIKNETAEK